MDKNTNDTEFQEDIELTGEDNIVEPELEDIEDTSNGKIKKLQDKLKVCEQEKMEHLENLQRAKAEFLNSKKRLEEERLRDKERAVQIQIEKLLPMYDSFTMAMQDKEAWESIDEVWRKGVEGIYTKLTSILDSYGVTAEKPEGQDFDPERHEAMANVPVLDASMHDKVMQVLQDGFVRKVHGVEELLRPARVTVGEFTQQK